MDIVMNRVAEKLKNLAENSYNDIIRTVATTMNGIITERIHEQGLDADNAKIGNYDTKPIYVNPEKSTRKFATEGKSGKTKFISTGLPHKTRYFAGGYNDFKTAIGRNQTGSVNLSLTGQLNNQLTVIETNNGFGLGWANKDLYERARFFETTKYKKTIWGVTESESEIINEIVQNAITDAIS
jgi:hypothetical protein